MDINEKSLLPSNGDRSESAKLSMDFRVHAALVRTAFSSEQTLMSWIRTSVSLFTFGFSITQFFYFLEQKQEGIQFSVGPRRLGLALICVGILALILAITEHMQRLVKLQEQGLPSIKRFILPIGSAVILLAIGIVALIGVTLNWSL